MLGWSRISELIDLETKISNSYITLKIIYIYIYDNFPDINCSNFIIKLIVLIFSYSSALCYHLKCVAHSNGIVVMGTIILYE